MKQASRGKDGREQRATGFHEQTVGTAPETVMTTMATGIAVTIWVLGGGTVHHKSPA